MKKEEIMQKIIDKQEDRIKLLNEFIELFDESEIIDNSYTTYYSIKNKLKLNNIEITNLKSQLAEAGEEKRCATCKWFKIGHGRCVWCLRNTPWNYEEFLKTSGYVDNWEPR